LQVAAIAARPVEVEPPVAVAIHSARDWPAGLLPMEAPVAVLANPHDQPTNAVCGISRNQALSQLTPQAQPSVTQIVVLPLSPFHSLPTPTAPDFSVSASSESNAQVQDGVHDAHSAAVQTSLTEETHAAGCPEPEGLNQPAATHPVADTGEVDVQQTTSDDVGQARPARNEHSPRDEDGIAGIALQDKPIG
jgi:hypothetical protein